jgi:hypothetical protein
MFRASNLIGAIAVTVLAAHALHAAEAFELKSVSVDLPESDATFPGPNADAINNNCLTCHSAGMVLKQPPLSRATWDAVVHKMINAYKAPIDQEDIIPIVDYLAHMPPQK